MPGLRETAVTVVIALALAVAGEAGEARAGEVDDVAIGEHGGQVTVVAVAGDGSAAVSSDGRGLRLWPSLDGTREPLVVRGPAGPRSLALGRDGAVHVIAAIDAAGGLSVLRVDDSGTPAGPAVSLGAAVQVALAAHRIIVRRPDSVVEAYDLAGAPRGRLVGAPGARLAQLAVHGDRALVLAAGAEGVHGRWLELAGELAWGATTARLPVDPDQPIALHPDAARIAARAPGSRQVRIVALADGGGPAAGRRVEAACVLDPLPRLTGTLQRVPRDVRDTTFAPLGFFDADILACASRGQLMWWSRARRSLGLDGHGAALAFGGGRVISGLGSGLALHVPPRGATSLAAPSLGSAAATAATVATTAATTGGDGVAVRGNTEPTSRYLGYLERSAAVPKTADLSRVVLDARTVAVVRPNPSVGRDAWGRGTRVVVLDAVSGAELQVLPEDTAQTTPGYAAGMLVTTEGERRTLRRYDPARRRFGPPVVLQLPWTARRVELVDPARAAGAIAIAVREQGDAVDIAEIAAADVARGVPLIAPRRSYRVPGRLRAIDRAGRIYIAAGPDLVLIYADARLHGVWAGVAGLAGLALEPSPSGDAVVAVGDARAILATPGGHTRWHAAVWGVDSVAWDAGGGLVARFPSGVAQLDLATGQLRGRRCGAGFGLHPREAADAHDGPSACDGP